jgi:aminopeptidase N
MENAGAITFREEYVFRSKVTRYFYERRCETILHEMAHMWFGDLVTMRWWDDLWLNESFATWASVTAQVAATEYTSAWTTFANVEKSWAYNQDQLASTHPIAADIGDLEAVEVNFDGITYAKGASVLKQLAAYVGFEAFLAGLRTYFDENAYGNATLADLMRHLSESSGRDMTAWARSWLQTTGLNRLEPVFDTDGDGRFTSFTIRQSGAAPGAGEMRPHRLAVGIYDDDAGHLVRTNRVELDVTGETTEVPELVGTSRGQLVLINDDDLSYLKLVLDPASLATAIDRVGDITDSLPRTLVWSAVWEMTRDAQMRARDFVGMALGGIEAETEIGVVQRVLGQVRQAVSSYADPQWARDTGWPQVADRTIELARGAAPGSDEQLAYVSSLAASSLSAEQLTVLAGWRDGSAALEGLDVDTDLNWTLLGALVAHGAAGEDEIAAAGRADSTASGQRRAMQATALRPQLEAKQQIWDRVITDDSMANALQDAAISGFAHPAQREVLDEFTQQYFDRVGAVWSRRSIEVAQKVAIGLYPRWAVAAATVEAAAAWQADDHPAALRRLVGEGVAGTERALAARSADRGL